MTEIGKLAAQQNSFTSSLKTFEPLPKSNQGHMIL